eukprot:TRINITY_DN357_c0_g1_i2.p1 TRINITY_DN357_c0_g1~~TRINITY_DN357_c0_g1_i2.p1  ORF type:complete len:821 (+),score=180.89 TRINITY_DN357_c0_g1_i2:181-2643(+)
MRLGSKEVHETAHKLSIFHEEVIREEEGWLLWSRLDNLRDVSWSNALLVVALVVLLLAPIPSSMGVSSPLSPVWRVEKEIMYRSVSGCLKTLQFAAIPFRLVMRLPALIFDGLSNVFPTLRSLGSKIVGWVWEGVKMPFYILRRICQYAFVGLRWLVSSVASLVCKCVRFVGDVFKAIVSFVRSVGVVLFGGSKKGSTVSGEDTGEISQPGLVVKTFTNVLRGLRWIGQAVINVLIRLWRSVVFVGKVLIRLPVATAQHSIAGIKGVGSYVVDFFKMIYHGIGYVVSKVVEVVVAVSRFCWMWLRWIVNKSITLPLKGVGKVWCFLRWIGARIFNGLRWIFSPIVRMVVWLKELFFLRSPASLPASTEIKTDDAQKPSETGLLKDGLFALMKKFVIKAFSLPLELLKFVWSIVKGSAQFVFEKIGQGLSWLKCILVGREEGQDNKKTEGWVIRSWRFLVSVASRVFSWIIGIPKNIVLGLWWLIRSIFLCVLNGIVWVLECVSGVFQWIFMPLVPSPSSETQRQLESRVTILLEELERAALMMKEGKYPCKCIRENGEEVQILDLISESSAMSSSRMDHIEELIREVNTRLEDETDGRKSAEEGIDDRTSDLERRMADLRNVVDRVGNDVSEMAAIVGDDSVLAKSINWASIYLHADIIQHSETFDPLGGWFSRVVSVVNPWKPLDRAELNDPRLVLTSKLEPGECWAMAGSSGFVTIRVSTSIIPESISISHVAIPETMSSALRDFKLFGHKNDWDAVKPVELMSGTFNTQGPRTQEFQIPDDVKDSYQIFSLKVVSNHGHPEYTCLYRVKIFGQVMDL